MPIKLSFLSILTLSFCSCQNNFAQPLAIPEGYQLVYQQSFEEPGSIYDFEMTDSTAWRWSSGSKQEKYLELFGKSKYSPMVTSPHNIAIIKDLIVGDFILEARLSQTGKEYNHRDLCLFFAIQNPSNFYYIHIATKADNHANNIFLVNDEPRIKIAHRTTEGTDWGTTNSWHTVRIKRIAEEGTIEVYFDNMEKPIMEATDTHFANGYIGFGSFDDTGCFDEIKIWAPKTIQPRKGFFK